METPRSSRCSATSVFWWRNSLSMSSVHEDILNESPRLSYHNPTINLERRVRREKSYSYQGEASARKSAAGSFVSSITPTSKLVEDLVREISTLEHDIIHKERHLLSLYRAAFDQYLVSSPAFKSPSVNNLEILRNAGLNKACNTNVKAYPTETIEKTCRSRGFKSNRESSPDFTYIKQSPADIVAANADIENGPSERISMTFGPAKSKAKRTSGHQSLADHLGASITDHVPQTCCKLSEDIIRCISAICCKLASPPGQSINQLASPTPSVSSSSTISRQDPASDNWSPKCHSETDKDKNCENNIVIEVQRLHLDSERFGYASEMFKCFRGLVRRLETIDPKKMAHEEQLAFWINIHNALIMHALLAYGLRDSHLRSSLPLLKAAYNIGGLSVNAYLIQSSILRCQPHLPSLWFGKLMLPALKLKKANGKHPYALDRAEPLVHFALCSGASLDPVLRVYKAKGLYQDLEIAKAEFIQSNVSVFSKSIVLLPKILQHYAKDSLMEVGDILEIVSNYVSEPQQKAIQGCYKKRHEKCVIWSRFKPSLRYFVHPELAKQYVAGSSYL